MKLYGWWRNFDFFHAVRLINKHAHLLSTLFSSKKTAKASKSAEFNAGLNEYKLTNPLRTLQGPFKILRTTSSLAQKLNWVRIKLWNVIWNWYRSLNSADIFTIKSPCFYNSRIWNDLKSVEDALLEFQVKLSAIAEKENASTRTK